MHRSPPTVRSCEARRGATERRSQRASHGAQHGGAGSGVTGARAERTGAAHGAGDGEERCEAVQSGGSNFGDFSRKMA